MAYVEKRYGLSRLLAAHLREGRRRPQIPLADVVRSVVLLFAQRLPSLHALDEVLRRRGRPLVEARVPSADTIGYAYARMDPQGLRAILAAIGGRARRQKALRPRGRVHPWAVAVDGHELFASYHRCCAQCCRRTVKTGTTERVQFYHRVVVAQFIETEPPLCLDVEPLGPGESEEQAAERLVARILERFPFVEVFSFDALYLHAPLLRRIVEAGRGAIVVLKEERRELLQDARGLFSLEPAREVPLGEGTIRYWDLPGLRSYEALGDIPVRVVRTIRRRHARHRIAGHWEEGAVEQDWTWATVGLDPNVSPLTIHLLGHARWDIENRGFNEQGRFFALDHCFHHEPHAIVSFLLTLFAAAALTEIFFTRNLKAPALRGRSLAGLARLLLQDPPRPGETSVWASARAP